MEMRKLLKVTTKTKKMKLDSLEKNSNGDIMLPLERTDSAVLIKVLNAEQTFFVAELEDGPGFYDHQSGRYLTKQKHLKGGDDWERMGGRYVQGRDAAMKEYRKLCDPAKRAREEKDKYYSNR
jgi:hypothetical protein